MIKKTITLLIAFLVAGCATPAPRTPADNLLPAQPTITQETQPSAAVPSPSGDIALPMTDAMSRITAKPFGTYVAPQKSPVQPEHFVGYHAGTDFEILPGEEDKDLPVYAICTGKINDSRLARGYGRVLIQFCNIRNREVTVTYGHLKSSSITKKAGDTLTAGENFALLGDAYSTDTDGERKHLHLAVKAGTTVDLRGYVQEQEDLAGWMDFRDFVELP